MQTWVTELLRGSLYYKNMTGADRITKESLYYKNMKSLYYKNMTGADRITKGKSTIKA